MWGEKEDIDGSSYYIILFPSSELLYTFIQAFLEFNE